MSRIDRRHFLKSTALAGVASSFATNTMTNGLLRPEDVNTLYTLQQ